MQYICTVVNVHSLKDLHAVYMYSGECTQPEGSSCSIYVCILYMVLAYPLVFNVLADSPTPASLLGLTQDDVCILVPVGLGMVHVTNCPIHYTPFQLLSTRSTLCPLFSGHTHSQIAIQLFHAACLLVCLCIHYSVSNTSRCMAHC